MVTHILMQRPPRAPRAQRVLGVVLAVLGLAAVLVTTLGSTTRSVSNAPLWCVTCLSLGSKAGLDVLLNVVLFVPLGSGLGLLARSRRRALAAVVAITLAVELLQLGVVAGRYASALDIFANGLGGAIGVALARGWRRWLLPAPGAAARLACFAAAAWLAVLTTSAWGLRPSLPRGEYRLSWRPGRHAADASVGRVLSASINGRAVRPGRVPRSLALRDRLGRDHVLIEAVLIASKPGDSRTPGVNLAADGRSVLLLTQDGRDLVLRLRRRAADVRLLAPTLRLSGVLPAAGEAADEDVVSTPDRVDTVRVVGAIFPGELHLHATTGGRRSTSVLRVGPSLGWTFLFPHNAVPPSTARWVTAWWIAALLLPLGYWGARAVWGSEDAAPAETGPRARGLGRAEVVVILLCAPVAGLSAVPDLFRLPPPHWSEWAAAAAAVATGLCVGWWSLGAARRLRSGLGTGQLGGSALGPDTARDSALSGSAAQNEEGGRRDRPRSSAYRLARAALPSGD